MNVRRHCMGFGIALVVAAGFVLVAPASSRGEPAPTRSDAIDRAIAATVKIVVKESKGTGFLIARPLSSDPSKQQILLVSAAHVLETASADECRLVLRESRPDGSFERKEITIKLRSADKKPLFVRHPEADVAVMKVELPPGSAIVPLPIESVMVEPAVLAGALKVADEVWIACYPVGLESSRAGFPVLRRGSVASFPLAPVKTYRTFMVDFSTFGGDSGAPVVALRPAATPASEAMSARLTPMIVGLVSGKHQQTDKVTLPFEERTVHHPLGLAIVIPSETIRQAIARLAE